MCLGGLIVAGIAPSQVRDDRVQWTHHLYLGSGIMTQKALMELAIVSFAIGILQWASESSSDGSTAFVMAAIFTIGACITH